MKLLKISALLLLTLLFACNGGDPVEEAKEENYDTFGEEFDMNREVEFMVEFTNYHYASAAMSDLAVKSATEEEVKLYAKDIKTDHNMLFERLKAIAGEVKVKLPTGPSEEMQARLSEMKTMEPERLTREYLDQMEVIHQEIQTLADKVIAETEMDQTLLDLARAVSAHQLRHLERAQNLQERIYPAAEGSAS